MKKTLTKTVLSWIFICLLFLVLLFLGAAITGVGRGIQNDLMEMFGTAVKWFALIVFGFIVGNNATTGKQQ